MPTLPRKIPLSLLALCERTFPSCFLSALHHYTITPTSKRLHINCFNPALPTPLFLSLSLHPFSPIDTKKRPRRKKYERLIQRVTRSWHLMHKVPIVFTLLVQVLSLSNCTLVPCPHICPHIQRDGGLLISDTPVPVDIAGSLSLFSFTCWSKNTRVVPLDGGGGVDKSLMGSSSGGVGQFLGEKVLHSKGASPLCHLTRNVVRLVPSLKPRFPLPRVLPVLPLGTLLPSWCWWCALFTPMFCFCEHALTHLSNAELMESSHEGRTGG